MAFIIVASFSAASFASKVELKATSCESFDDNKSFVFVETEYNEQYLIKRNLGEETCGYLLDGGIAGYELSLCLDFSRKLTGVDCKPYRVKEFVIPVWPEENETLAL